MIELQKTASNAWERYIRRLLKSGKTDEAISLMQKMTTNLAVMGERAAGPAVGEALPGVLYRNDNYTKLLQRLHKGLFMLDSEVTPETYMKILKGAQKEWLARGSAVATPADVAKYRNILRGKKLGTTASKHYQDPEELINIVHGGGENHIRRFLAGDTKGYNLEKLPDNIDRVGIQVHPFRQLSAGAVSDVSDRTRFYAARAAGAYFDQPAVLRGKIKAKYLQAAPNGYEAGIPYYNARYIQDPQVERLRIGTETPYIDNKTLDGFLSDILSKTSSLSRLGGMSKHAIYIPFVTPAIGRVMTNVIPPAGYDMSVMQPIVEQTVAAPINAVFAKGRKRRKAREILRYLWNDKPIWSLVHDRPGNPDNIMKSFLTGEKKHSPADLMTGLAEEARRRRQLWRTSFGLQGDITRESLWLPGKYPDTLRLNPTSTESAANELRSAVVDQKHRAGDLGGYTHRIYVTPKGHSMQYYHDVWDFAPNKSDRSISALPRKALNAVTQHPTIEGVVPVYKPNAFKQIGFDPDFDRIAWPTPRLVTPEQMKYNHPEILDDTWRELSQVGMGSQHTGITDQYISQTKGHIPEKIRRATPLTRKVLRTEEMKNISWKDALDSTMGLARQSTRTKSQRIARILRRLVRR